MEAEKEDQTILTLEAMVGEVLVAEEDTIISNRVRGIVSLSQMFVHFYSYSEMNICSF